MSDNLSLTGWAVVLPANCTGTGLPAVVVELGHDVSEARAWRVALGWPTRGEVKDARKRGARAFRCRVVEEPPS